MIRFKDNILNMTFGKRKKHTAIIPTAWGEISFLSQEKLHWHVYWRKFSGLDRQN